MFDFQMLAGATAALDRPLLYLYRTGILRRRMREFLRKSQPSLGTDILAPDPAGSLRTLRAGRSALFPNQKYIFDLGSNPSLAAISALRRSLDDEDPFIVGVFVASQGLEVSSWTEIRSLLTVVEEPVVSRSTIVPILRFLERETDLADRPDLLSKPGFVAMFNELVECRADLPELIHKFDATVAAADMGTEVFVAGDSDSLGGPSIRASLRRQILSPTSMHSIAFVQVVDRLRATGVEPRSVLLSLIRGTNAECRTIMRASARTKSQWHALDLAARWTALLLASMVDLQEAVSRRPFGNRPETLVVIIERVARAYRDAVTKPDPLEGRWSELARAVKLLAAGREADTSRSWKALLDVLKDICSALSSAADWPWRARLRSTLGSPVAMERLLHGRRLAIAPETRPRQVFGWDSIYGQETAVKALRTRVRLREHASTLILHGPRGVGKRTVAALYAKAGLCERPLDDNPCDACEACLWFNRGGAWGYANGLDASDPNAANQFERIVAGLRQPSFAAHTFVILRGAERMRARAFDVLLKALETPSPRATFVFLTETLRNFPLAGLSRSQALALRPLNHADSDRFLRSRLPSSARTIDERAIELLVSSAGGLPAELERLSLLGDNQSGLKLDNVRQALRPFEPSDIRRAIPAVLATFDTALGELPTMAVSKLTSRRTAEILVQVYLQLKSGDASYSPFVALRSLSVEDRRTIVEVFAGAAQGLERKPTEAWAQIAAAVNQ